VTRKLAGVSCNDPNIIRSDNITINMSILSEPESLKEYVEGWRMKLWDIAYTGVFKEVDAFKK